MPSPSNGVTPMSGVVRIALLAVFCGLVAAGGAGRAADAPPAPLQRQQVEAIIHDYLMQHPDVLIAALRQAEDKLHKDDEAKASHAVVRNRQAVFNDPSTPVGGNPHGDVSIVEFFDYRCPYCKEVEPSLEAMVKQDPNCALSIRSFRSSGRSRSPRPTPRSRPRTKANTMLFT